MYWESLQWQSAVSVAAVRQLKSQIALNQHHLQAQVNLRANNDERNLFRQLSSWWELEMHPNQEQGVSLERRTPLLPSEEF